MDIEGMGESVVAQLVALKLVRNFADIYKLKEEDLETLELFKEKKISNLLAGIKRSKTRPLSRLIYALGIRHVGEKAAFVLAQRFKTLDKLIFAKKDELDEIYEVGSVMSEAIEEYFRQDSTKEIIEGLRKAGVNFKEETHTLGNSALTGKNIVFTGELKNYSRADAEGIVRRLGGNPVSSVSKNTDFVVSGDNPGTKYDKAKKLGVKIIDEDKFKEMIK
jgi:DNA ligase (NAD+)